MSLTEEKMIAKFKENLKTARKLIKGIGYHQIINRGVGGIGIMNLQTVPSAIILTISNYYSFFVSFMLVSTKSNL